MLIFNKVKNSEITGTGFFIENGYLLTNSHVVDIKGDIIVEYSDGKTSKATLVSNEIVSDLAILKVDSVNALALPLGETLNIKSTDDLYAIGYAFDLKGEASITKGILSARRSIAGSCSKLIIFNIRFKNRRNISVHNCVSIKI